MTPTPTPPAPTPSASGPTWGQALVPSRAILLLMGIGFLDLVMTAVLHAHGLIVELNPLMRPLIEHSEWTFSAVKAGTLFAAWGVMAWYGQTNRAFVRRACLWGAAVYLTVWTLWFFGSMHMG